MRKIRNLSFIVLFLGIFSLQISTFKRHNNQLKPVFNFDSKIATPTLKPTPSPIAYPVSYEIPLRTHSFQRFNNCGPASLSMALSYFDVYLTQEEIGRELRPYQVANGDNDDKSVTLAELAGKAEGLGFKSYYRPNGNITLFKRFISQNIPVITRTITKPGEDIGHFRIVRGYNSTHLIQDDSLQGKGLKYTFADFEELWKQFNSEYLVIVPKNKIPIAENIIGEDVDKKVAWQKAAIGSNKILQEDPNDVRARFNLSVALYNAGDFLGAVNEFEKAEKSLTFRTLWYQIEPIRAYYELGNYERVFAITNSILDNHNRAFSELYLIRGDIYLKQGEVDAAKAEFEKAVFYNINLKEAQEKLKSVS